MILQKDLCNPKGLENRDYQTKFLNFLLSEEILCILTIIIVVKIRNVNALLSLTRSLMFASTSGGQRKLLAGMGCLSTIRAKMSSKEFFHIFFFTHIKSDSESKSPGLNRSGSRRSSSTCGSYDLGEISFSDKSLDCTESLSDYESA